MEDCPFIHGSQSATRCCGAATNFALEATNSEDVCASCDVVHLTKSDHCRHLEMYGYLYVDRGRRHAWRVGAMLACGLDARVVEPGDCRECVYREVSDLPLPRQLQLDQESFR